jgi:hypothetical protein
MFQFWIHTDLVKRLWFGLEYVINSPSAHRMHHRPPGNCNYGGVLIIWDRMFGTFVPEVSRRDYYGLAKQPKTFDPVKLNLQHYATLSKLSSRSRRTAATRERAEALSGTDDAGALARGGARAGGLSGAAPRNHATSAPTTAAAPTMSGGRPLPLPRTGTWLHSLAGHLATVARIFANIRARRVRWKWVFEPSALFTPLPADGPEDLRPEGPVRAKWNGHRPSTGVGYGLRATVHAATLALSVVLLVVGKAMHPYDACSATVCGLALLSCVGRTWDNLPGEAEKALVLAAGLFLPVMATAVFVQPARRAIDAGWGTP